MAEWTLAQSLKKENLGNRINSEHSDFAPVISPDGNTLFFTRQIATDQEIYFSEKQADGTWGYARDIGSPLNNEYSNAVFSVLPDGNTIMVLGYYRGKELVKKGYSMASKAYRGWGYPQGVDMDGYEEMTRESYYVSARLSKDNKSIIMSFDNRKGISSIYVSHRKADGTWARPKNLGEKINSGHWEAGPYLASDGKTLYFSSGRPGGLGGADIYVSTRLDDTWTNWSEPKNLGAPYNTTEDDIYFVLPASGEYAFISSLTPGRKMDIYKIKLKSEIKPAPVVLVKGTVYDAETKAPLGASILYEILPQGLEAGSAQSNKQSGKYSIVLPPGNQYGFLASLEGYFPVSENIDLSNLQEYKEITRDLYLVPIKVGSTIRLNNLFFDFAKDHLRNASFPELNRVVKLLKNRPNIFIEVGGHTDAVGSDANNQDLSERRAQACVNYLISQGIAQERMIARGYGESQPIASNETDAGRQQNRRVEFKILDKIASAQHKKVSNTAPVDTEVEPSPSLSKENTNPMAPLNYKTEDAQRKLLFAIHLEARKKGLGDFRQAILKSQIRQGDVVNIKGQALSTRAVALFQGVLNAEDGNIISLKFQDTRRRTWVEVSQSTIDKANLK